MKRLLNTYPLADRALAESACHRLNRDPYTLTRNERKRPIYTLRYNHTKNRLEIIGEYFLLDSSDYERKQARNRERTTKTQKTNQ
jgi:hypothetical protein